MRDTWFVWLRRSLWEWAAQGFEPSSEGQREEQRSRDWKDATKLGETWITWSSWWTGFRWCCRLHRRCIWSHDGCQGYSNKSSDTLGTIDPLRNCQTLEEMRHIQFNNVQHSFQCFIIQPYSTIFFRRLKYALFCAWVQTLSSEAPWSNGRMLSKHKSRGHWMGFQRLVWLFCQCLVVISGYNIVSPHTCTWFWFEKREITWSYHMLKLHRIMKKALWCVSFG